MSFENELIVKIEISVFFISFSNLTFDTKTSDGTKHQQFEKIMFNKMIFQPTIHLKLQLMVNKPDKGRPI